MSLIWATRGRDWGFRFLRKGGHDDPLPLYEEILDGLGDAAEGVVRAGDRVGVRFPDPEGRVDRAGRVIPHEFVLTGPIAGAVHDPADALQMVWPLVADEYATVWDQERAPLPFD